MSTILREKTGNSPRNNSGNFNADPPYDGIPFPIFLGRDIPPSLILEYSAFVKLLMVDIQSLFYFIFLRFPPYFDVGIRLFVL